MRGRDSAFGPPRNARRLMPGSLQRNDRRKGGPGRFDRGGGGGAGRLSRWSGFGGCCSRRFRALLGLFTWRGFGNVFARRSSRRSGWSFGLRGVETRAVVAGLRTFGCSAANELLDQMAHARIARPIGGSAEQHRDDVPLAATD